MLNAVGLTCRNFTMLVDSQWQGAAIKEQRCEHVFVVGGRGVALLRLSGRPWVLQYTSNGKGDPTR
jgi:hypothetical protein